MRSDSGLRRLIADFYFGDIVECHGIVSVDLHKCLADFLDIVGGNDSAYYVFVSIFVEYSSGCVLVHIVHRSIDLVERDAVVFHP